VTDVDAALARARARAATLDDAAEALGDIRCRAESPGGAVSAVVDGAGALVDLHLTGPADARLILQTVHAAARDAARRRRTVLDDLVTDLGR
jgi:DNA-binding protein YbaB